MSVKPIPEGYHTVTPYMIAQDAAHLIAFLKQAFDAEQMDLVKNPDGQIMHAEMKIGDSMIMLADAMDRPAMPAGFYLYVPDTDATYKQAIAAGGISIMEPADQFYGDRTAGVKDTLGNFWWIGTHKESVSPDEMKKRMAAQTPAQA